MCCVSINQAFWELTVLVLSDDLQLDERKKRMWRASLARPLWNPIKMYYNTLSQVGHCHLHLVSSFPALQYPRLDCFPNRCWYMQRRLWEEKRRHTLEICALMLAGCKMFFNQKTLCDWDCEGLSSEEGEDVGGSAAAEAEADSNWHLVTQRAPHTCLGSFKVGRTWNIQKKL